MTNFWINNEIIAKGEMTVQQELVGQSIVVSGVMELDKYIEDIQTISTEIFCVVGVTITKEVFGTNDTKVVYEFKGTGFGLDKDLFNSQTEGE